jgi:hypothetical protein
MSTTIRLPLAGLVLAAVLGACSGAAAAPSVASLEDPGASSSPAASSAPTDPREAFLAYAQCMRDNGIDMPDPDFSGGRGGGLFSALRGVDPSSPTFQTAMEACQPILADAGFGPGGNG